ncbi:putative phage abortive infection protein [Pseudomonas sp. SDM007_2]|uniref:putative phage abortive infection protein n=1 Tax=Pseudomonas hygromyciniae TaxID=2812000 RepID=UPI001967CF20|nr:putative phage abortive infection protein [Pseudomonas hygromyciniae]MBN0975986.1 putative phage abortive infection protein [Pseudomonas hygromyciniae]
MSWFELRAADLDYRNLMGSWRYGELTPYGWLGFSFSDIPWFFYALFFGFSLFCAKLLYARASMSEDRIAGYCRVAIVLFSVLFLYGCYLVGLLWDTPFVSVPGQVREGVFGDSFGTLNALFSGLAFSGVLITLLFQRKDLSETRSQIARQQIESQFYNMLNQQQEIVRNLDLQKIDTDEVFARGRDCFREWAAMLDEIHKNCVKNKVDNPKRMAYQAIYHIGRTDLGLYFRSLYSVFRFVDESKHQDSDKFGVVVRSLISDYELVLIFYNCLSEKGVGFSKYVYRFGLFDNLDDSLLLSSEDINLFTYEAYGSNQYIIGRLKSGPPDRNE